MDVTLRTVDITAATQSPKAISATQVGIGGTGKSEATVKGTEQAKSVEANPLSREDVEHMTEQMNKLMELMNTDVHFTLHEKTKRLIVQMVDQRDGTVLKEFPPRELLDTIANIQDYVGMILDKKA